MPADLQLEDGGQARPSRPSLYKGEMSFRRLLEQMPAGAYTCDTHGLITYFNHHAVSLWGRAPRLNDPIDRFCGSFKLFSASGEPIRHDECWMALALQTGGGYNGEEIIVEQPNGKRLTVLAHANPIRDASGTLVGAVNVLVDISDRKRQEVALLEADRNRNQFLATLAHELRNPLAPASSALEILRMETAALPDCQWALAVIDRQMKRMTRLVDDLVDIARVTANQVTVTIAPVELARVLQLAVENSQRAIGEAGHTLSVSVPDEPIVIDADETRLAQAITNLLNNAAKYTPRGGHIELVGARVGTSAVISVRDNGIGISEEMQHAIFDMFTQVHQSGTEPHEGLGIGLALVRRLVEQHRGTVTVESAGPGQGSHFTVRLPLRGATSARRDG